MEIPAAVTEIFPADFHHLLDLIRPEIDDEILTTISRADYGSGADVAMRDLRFIRDQGKLSEEIGARLSEVLELTRWSLAPDGKKFKTAPPARKASLTAAFVCALLFQSTTDSTEESTLAIGLFHAAYLGIPVQQAWGSFLVWIWQQHRPHPPHFLLLIGLLILALRLGTQFPTEKATSELAKLTVQVWDLSQSDHPASLPRMAEFGVLYGFWQPLAEELLIAAEQCPLQELRENLQLCALMLEL